MLLDNGKQKKTMAPVKPVVGGQPPVSPSPTGAPPQQAKGSNVLATIGKNVQQGAANYAGTGVGAAIANAAKGSRAIPVAGGLPGRTIPSARPVGAPQPAQVANRAFRQESAGAGNYMRGAKPAPAAATSSVGGGYGMPPPVRNDNPFGGVDPFKNIKQNTGSSMIDQVTGLPNALQGVTAQSQKSVAPAPQATELGATTNLTAQPQGGQHVTMGPQASTAPQTWQGDGGKWYTRDENGNITASDTPPAGADVVTADPNQTDDAGGGNGGTPAGGGGGGFDPRKLGNTVLHGQGDTDIGSMIQEIINGAKPPTAGQIGSGAIGAATDVARGLADAVVKPAAGAAEEINKANRPVMDQWFGDYGLQGNKDYAKGLLDPNVQAAAEQADKDQLRSDVDYNTDRNLRMQMSSAAGGGRMGGGSTQAAYDSANKATADGQRKLISDAFNRKLQAGQLGTQINSDAARQINAILNDQYTSPNDIMAIMAQIAPEVFGDITQLMGQLAQAGKSPIMG